MLSGQLTNYYAQPYYEDIKNLPECRTCTSELKLPHPHRFQEARWDDPHDASSAHLNIVHYLKPRSSSTKHVGSQPSSPLYQNAQKRTDRGLKYERISKPQYRSASILPQLHAYRQPITSLLVEEGRPHNNIVPNTPASSATSQGISNKSQSSDISSHKKNNAYITTVKSVFPDADSFLQTPSYSKR